MRRPLRECVPEPLPLAAPVTDAVGALGGVALEEEVEHTPAAHVAGDTQSASNMQYSAGGGVGWAAAHTPATHVADGGQSASTTQTGVGGGDGWAAAHTPM